MIKGKTKVLGVLGSPIEHTLSPLIHNTLAYYTGIDQVYVPFECDNRYGAEAMVKGAFSLGIKGMNVTVPYKTDVLPYVKVEDPVAQVVGAVNTLVRYEDGFKGYNTDVEGLYRALKANGISVTDKAVILLGAGGAARAALYMAIREKASHIYILNRTAAKAKELAEEFSEKMKYDNISVHELDKWDEIPDGDAVVLQCSSVGLNDPDKAIIEDIAFYKKKVGALYDAVYKPSETKAMKLAASADKEAYNGLEMLMYQGIRAYELFHEVEVDEKVCKEIYEAMCKNA